MALKLVLTPNIDLPMPDVIFPLLYNLVVDISLQVKRLPPREYFEVRIGEILGIHTKGDAVIPWKGNNDVSFSADMAGLQGCSGNNRYAKQSTLRDEDMIVGESFDLEIQRSSKCRMIAIKATAISSTEGITFIHFAICIYTVKSLI